MYRKYLFQLLVGIIILVVLNVLGQSFFYRWDLTEEKRYTISPATKNLLENLEDEVFIKIYLKGDFPADFKRLQKSIEETLDEFKIYAGTNIKYRFVDPSIAESDTERNQNYQQLVEKGIPPTNVIADEDGKKVEKIIFPGALLYYKNKEMPVLLFKSDKQRMLGAPSPEEILNQSVENVEYNLASAIRTLTTNKPKIGFIEGHGELSGAEVYDIQQKVLPSRYEVYRVDITSGDFIDPALEAIIVAKPDCTFNDDDKYKIDQYIMNGGKALFFMDAVGVYMDSVLQDKGSFTFPYDHNLMDLLFKYGVRLNTTLIKDIYCSALPLVVGREADNRPKIERMLWQYYPLINNVADHPITKNLGSIESRFLTTLDTVKASGIQKTPLLYTSQSTKLVNTPAFVTFNEARENFKPQEYTDGIFPVAYLLEGKFTSMFKSRILPTDERAKNFIEEGKESKIIVVSDGDLLRNEVKGGQPIPLGVDVFSGMTFSNKDFVTNSLDYLLDNEGIIYARNKEIKLRPLNKNQIQTNKSFWQFLNLGLPLFLLGLMGVVIFLWRRRKYSL